MFVNLWHKICRYVHGVALSLCWPKVLICRTHTGQACHTTLLSFCANCLYFIVTFFYCKNSETYSLNFLNFVTVFAQSHVFLLQFIRLNIVYVGKKKTHKITIDVRPNALTAIQCLNRFEWINSWSWQHGSRSRVVLFGLSWVRNEIAAGTIELFVAARKYSDRRSRIQQNEYYEQNQEMYTSYSNYFKLCIHNLMYFDC